MISINNYLGTKYIRSEFVQGKHNSQKFLLSRGVVSLRCVQRSGSIIYHMYSLQKFLDGFSGYFQICIAPEDQHKTTFAYPFGTYAYRKMPLGLCNAPGTFQPCMMSIFTDLLKHCIEVFMDDFSVYGSSFDHWLSNLARVLERCEETNLF